MGHAGSAHCYEAIPVPGTAPISSGQTVPRSLLSAGADASLCARAAPRRQGAASHQAHLRTLLGLLAEVHIDLTIGLQSISTTQVLQLGMVNQPLMQLRSMGCVKSSAASKMWLQQPAACPRQLPTTQSLGKLPHPTAAFPGTGLQKEGKGSLTALPVGLDCVWRSQVWAPMFAELQVKDCCLPLVQITALLTGTSSRAQQAVLLPGLRQHLEVSSTTRLTAEIHTALS